MNAGQFKAGQPAWNRKTWIKKICPKCQIEFSVKQSLDRVIHCSYSCRSRGTKPYLGKKHSPHVRLKMRNAKLGIRGPDHWNWRGGSGTERHQAMGRDEYKQWRTAVFERDNFTCQFCGLRGVTLHADHIKPWATHPELRFDVGNGRALCVACHHKTPSFPTKLIPKEMRS